MTDALLSFSVLDFAVVYLSRTPHGCLSACGLQLEATASQRLMNAENARSLPNLVVHENFTVQSEESRLEPVNLARETLSHERLGIDYGIQFREINNKLVFRSVPKRRCDGKASRFDTQTSSGYNPLHQKRCDGLSQCVKKTIGVRV